MAQEVESGKNDFIQEYLQELKQYGGEGNEEYEFESLEETKIRHPLDGMPDDELIQLVEETENEAELLRLENNAFMIYCRDNQISLKLNNALLIRRSSSQATSQEIVGTIPTSTRRRTSSYSLSDMGSRVLNPDKSLAYSMSSLQMLRVIVSEKGEIVTKVTEDIKKDLDNLRKRCQKKKRNLLCDLEEVNQRRMELVATTNIFEHFVHQEENKFTHELPLDKYIHFFQDSIRNTLSIIDHIRLGYSYLLGQYRVLSIQYKEKSLLGETIVAADFLQLEIENKHLDSEIDRKNKLVLEVKKLNGQSSLALTKCTRRLMTKQDEMAAIQTKIKLTNEKIIKISADCDHLSNEIEKLQHEYDELKHKTQSYWVPKTMDYLQTKVNLQSLTIKERVWRRKRNLQEVQKRVLTSQLKKMTGSKVVLAKWFKEPVDEELEEVYKFSYELQNN